MNFKIGELSILQIFLISCGVQKESLSKNQEELYHIKSLKRAIKAKMFYTIGSCLMKNFPTITTFHTI